MCTKTMKTYSSTVCACADHVSDVFMMSKSPLLRDLRSQCSQQNVQMHRKHFKQNTECQVQLLYATATQVSGHMLHKVKAAQVPHIDEIVASKAARLSIRWGGREGGAGSAPAARLPQLG